MIQILEAAEAKGLNPSYYDSGLWSGRVAAIRQNRNRVSDPNLGRFDLALTVSVARYIADLHLGRVNPGSLVSCLEMEHQKCEIPLLLRSLVTSCDVTGLLSKIEPSFPGYHRTLTALRIYLEMAGKDDGELLPSVEKPLKPGTRYIGLPRLRQLLCRLGDLHAEAPTPETQNVYEGALVDAVKRFQTRHGLEPDGHVGKATLRQLNTPIRQRVRQLQFTLERYRWVPHQFDRPPIVVNIPEFRLRGLNNSYNTEIEMKVVVGRALRHQTPVFSAGMTSVIFRPYWKVPSSIQRAELVPKLHRDPGHLARNNYEILDSANAVALTAKVDATTLRKLSAGSLRIRQLPGPTNALGLVKFVLPNNHSVYLHDTPATELFAKSRRDFSHGCIRVEKPATLADWVLKQKPEWTPDRITDAMRGNKTVQVNLDTAIPVLIVYATAVVLETGEVRFFHDIYGHDAALEKRLACRYEAAKQELLRGPGCDSN
jgi:murein L,D-transpeptidase YcbB/YkuD